jgi:hypothetical protein
MPEASYSAGFVVDWGTEHRDGKGNLISRQAMVRPPEITCVKPSCLWRYTLKSLRYTLTLLYHQYRVQYAEKYRHKEIPEYYRTGEDAPESFVGLIAGILKLLWKT